MTMKSQSIINKQLQIMSKKMLFFEGAREQDGLMIKDFKRIQWINKDGRVYHI